MCSSAGSKRRPEDARPIETPVKNVDLDTASTDVLIHCY